MLPFVYLVGCAGMLVRCPFKEVIKFECKKSITIQDGAGCFFGFKPVNLKNNWFLPETENPI